jgi:type IV secretion system protein VirD4
VKRHPPAHEGLAAALVVAALALISGYLYLVLGVAGALFGAGWPHVTLEGLWAGITHWLGDPGDPAAGFPAPVRAALPGTLGIYATLVVLSAASAWLAHAARHSRRSSGFGHLLRALPGHAGGQADAERGARWAKPSELGRLNVNAPGQARLTIGYCGSQLIAVERRHSLLVVGPTQSGKSSGLCVPALLEWEGPVLASSVKHDLLEHSEAARARKGPVWVYDPSPFGARQSASWNPLEHCLTWEGARRMAQWLVQAAGAAPGQGGGEQRFWASLGEKLLAALLFAAAREPGRTMADVVSWMNRREIEEVEAALGAGGETLALEAWEASLARDERTVSSVYASVESVLGAYGDPRVLGTTIGEGISGERLIDSGGTVYLCGSVHEQRRLAPLFSALVQEVFTAAYERYERTGRPLSPPLLVLLDEAGNIAPIPDLAARATTAAGIGVQLISVWHDLSQLHATYGEEAATTLANHRGKLVLSGIADGRTVRWVSEVLGNERRRQVTRTRGERPGYSESFSERPLAPPWLTRQQEPGRGILVYDSLPPAKVSLRPFFADRRLAALAKGEQAPESPARALLARMKAVAS